jgi:transmembrane sensor
MNKPSPFRNPRLDKEQAGQWLARLDRGLSNEEQESFKEWLRDPPRREILLRLARDWDSMSVVAELAELFPLREAEGSDWRFLGRAAVVLVAAAVAALAIYWRPSFGPALSADVAAQPAQRNPAAKADFNAVYSTRVGERRTIELPDHSRIQLNTNTELQVQLSNNARRLTMSRGEAMFEVAKDPGRVFTVRASGYEFKAVGTAFDVRSDSPSEVQLTVTEGRVRVHQGVPIAASAPASHGVASEVFEDATDVEVEANRGVSIAERSERIDALTPEQVAVATAWQRGVLIFKETPLAQVVNELARYSTKRFVMADPELGRIPVSGYFQVGDTDTLIAALQQNVGISISPKGGYLVLSSAPQKQ